MTFAGYWLTFGAFFLLVGAAGARALVGQERRDRRNASADQWERRLGSAAALVLVAAAAVRLLAQALSTLDPGEHLSLDPVRAVLGTTWGVGWRWQAGAAVAALLASRGPPRLALLGAVAAGITLPLTGHALESSPGPVAAVSIHGVHALAGAAWLGTLAVVMLRWWLGVAPDRAHNRDAWLARSISAFSPLAFGAALTVILSGVAAAIPLLGGFGGLWSSGYGRVLLLKVSVLLGVLALGAWNWRELRPALGAAVASRRLWRSALAELMLAVVILGLTASLISLPPPHE